MFDYRKIFDDYKKLFNQIKDSDYRFAGDFVDFRITICYEEKIIKLLFQESRGKRDWQNNFDFPVKIYKNQESCLLAHRGFGNAYKSANDVIMLEIAEYLQKFPDFDILIAGWSHGGALAVLAAEDIFYRFKKRSILITYGAPKVLFGKKSRKYLKDCVQEAFQFANINDIVTYLPPFPGYCHVDEIRIGEKFNLKKLCNPLVYHCNYGEIDLL